MRESESFSDSLGSPPVYEAAPESHFNKPLEKAGRILRGYTSLPTDEDISVLEEGHSLTSTVSEMGLSLDRGVITGLHSKGVSADRLSSLLLAQRNPDQQMYMRITGHYARTSKVESESELQAFSFSVPLMTCQYSQASLFALADDMPCLRGGRVKIASYEEGMLARGCLSKGWNIAANTDMYEVYQANQEGCMPASAESVSQMKARFKHIVLPPWLPLGQAWTQMWREGQTCGNIIDADAIKRALGFFLHDKPLAWCRWLIVPQTAYGWDFHLIEEELNRMIERPSFLGAWSGTKPIAYISTSLGGIDNDLPSAFAIRLFASKTKERLYRNLRFNRLSSIIFSALFLLFYISILFVMSVDYCKGKVSGATLVTFIACLVSSLLLMVLVVFILPAQEKVFCNIGVAWALKSWASVNIPASNSRQEVIKLLRLRDRSFAAMSDDKINLQRRADGWYLMAGIKEDDWMQAHRATIEKAIRERKDGPLDIASTVELDIVRQRLAQYDGDGS